MGKRVKKTSNNRNGDNSGLGIEVVLSLVLRWGVISSAAVIFLGVVLMLATGESGYGAGFEINNLLHYNDSSVAEAFYPTNLQTIFTGLLSMKPFAVIDLGLTMLIATPIMRVGMAAVVFGIKGDKKYVAIASLVLAILLLGILTSS